MQMRERKDHFATRGGGDLRNTCKVFAIGGCISQGLALVCRFSGKKKSRHRSIRYGWYHVAPEIMVKIFATFVV
jgi:hypothetical protein